MSDSTPSPTPPSSPGSDSSSNSNANANAIANANANSNIHDLFDGSGNIVYTHTHSVTSLLDTSMNHCDSTLYTYDVFDVSGNIVNPPFLLDNSGNLLDLSMNILYNVSNIVDISCVTINGVGYSIVNKTSIDHNGNVLMHTTFTSTEPHLYDPNISGNFIEYVSIYDNLTVPTSETSIVMNQIIDYASKIKCDDFHGKGTIDDYAELFSAASKIATETKQIQLDVDIDGFNEFGRAADELAALFTNFTLRLENINIINDLNFLKAVANALEKLYNLSEIFGRFKDTIMCKSAIHLPKSTQDTNVILDNVMSEINCAMQYITNFVDVTNPNLYDYELSTAEKNIIANAVTTIDNWNVICTEGVSITMNTNPAIVSINNKNQLLKNSTSTLTSLTNTLKQKLCGYMD